MIVRYLPCAPEMHRYESRCISVDSPKAIGRSTAFFQPCCLKMAGSTNPRPQYHIITPQTTAKGPIPEADLSSTPETLSSMLTVEGNKAWEAFHELLRPSVHFIDLGGSCISGNDPAPRARHNRIRSRRRKLRST
jgi:hypothetical protein